MTLTLLSVLNLIAAFANIVMAIKLFRRSRVMRAILNETSHVIERKHGPRKAQRIMRQVWAGLRRNP